MTTARIDLEPAFILHARGYRETSQLIEVFSRYHGRMGLVARGARRPKSAFRGILNPFQPLRLSWSGRGELLTLRDAETAGPAIALGGDAVLAGFYLNELMLRFLQRNDPHPDLFALYAGAVSGLAGPDETEAVLRAFEMELLAETGYALNLLTDAVEHAPLLPEMAYEFVPDRGPVPATAASGDNPRFRGAELLAIARRDYADAAVRKSARRLFRHVINYHLGDRGLHTRRVAAAMKRQPGVR